MTERRFNYLREAIRQTGNCVWFYVCPGVITAFLCDAFAIAVKTQASDDTKASEAFLLILSIVLWIGSIAAHDYYMRRCYDAWADFLKDCLVVEYKDV